MPSASPIAVIMLMMKNDREVNCPSTEEMATVTMIEPMAMLMGMNAATRAPKTEDEHDHRGGQPELQLPLVRSDSDSSLKSWSRVLAPVMVTSKPAAESAATTSSSTFGDAGFGVVTEHEGHNRRVAVLREGRLLGCVGVPDGLSRTGVLN
jgi:hypothetical protein